MLLTIAALLGSSAALPARVGEEPVDAYEVADANAGARPYADADLFANFGGHAGVDRIVDDLVIFSVDDPRIAEIFKGQDLVRLRRTLKEQFCYLLGGGCAYSGRDMKTSHRDHGIQTADFNALVEQLQRAMRKQRVPFGAQNRLLAKLAPMKRDVVER